MLLQNCIQFKMKWEWGGKPYRNLSYTMTYIHVPIVYEYVQYRDIDFSKNEIANLGCGPGYYILSFMYHSYVQYYYV